jgi:hypothetical protein
MDLTNGNQASTSSAQFAVNMTKIQLLPVVRRAAASSSRVFVALWIIGCLFYVPVHLYTAPHWDDSSASITDGHHDADFDVLTDSHDGHNDHQPHSASQHKLKVTQTVRPILDVQFVASPLMPAVFTPQSTPQPFSYERVRPPGEHSPQPSQPRAPPLA